MPVLSGSPALFAKTANSQVLTIFAEKNVKSYIFFNKNISMCAIFNDQSFNDTLTNDIVSFLTTRPCFFFLISP